MPLKLNVGLNKKVGEANYGSRGASVNLEIELDSQLVTDPGKLHERIRQCFGMVRTALDEELNGGNGHGPASDPHGTNGNGQRPNGGRPATQSQVKAIEAIARRQRINLGSYLADHCGVTRIEDLSIQEASQVIDNLKGAATARS